MSEQKDIMPIVAHACYPHYPENKNCPYGIQQSADFAVLRCETCYAKATCPNYPDKDSLKCTEYQNWGDGIQSERAKWAKKDVAWLMVLNGANTANHFNSQIWAMISDHIAAHRKQAGLEERHGE